MSKEFLICGERTHKQVEAYTYYYSLKKDTKGEVCIQFHDNFTRIGDIKNRTRNPNNPESRTKGVGSELFSKIKELANNRNHEYIIASSVSPKSIEFFKKKGFRPVTEKDKKKLIDYIGYDTTNDYILELI